MGGSPADAVVVVGAGPTGLLLAGELARRGVPCHVLERREARTSEFESRAVGMHARTLELLAMRGMAAEVDAAANTIPRMRLSLGESDIRLDRLPTAFAGLRVIPQGRTEEILERHATRHGVVVRRGTRVLEIGQDGGGATLRVGDGRRTWEQRAAWVVGCDGARSVVRRCLGLDFPGHTYPFAIILADVRLRHPPDGALRISAARGGLVFSAEFGNGWHRLGIIDRDLAWSDTPVSLEEVRDALVKLLGRDLGPSEPLWTSRFRIEERQTASYRAGRVLLAGDAAHIHSPLGGQGLNLGLQDAMNLGWKLAAVARGEVGDALLDTYEAERRPVVTRVVRMTDAMTRMLTADAVPPRAVRRVAVPAVLRLRATNRRLSGQLSGIDLRYGGERRHGLVGRRVPDLVVSADGGSGRSLLAELASARFVLVDTTGGALAGACAPWGERVRVLAGRTSAADGFAHAAGILVRPDGHCAWAGDATDLAGLTTTLATWCGVPVPVARQVRPPAGPGPVPVERPQP